MINRLKTAACVCAALTLSACGSPGLVTGDGDIHSLGGNEEAELQFYANSCDGIDKSHGVISLQDEAAIDWENIGGIDFSGTVNETYYCSLQNIDPNAPSCSCNDGFQEIKFSYVSNNENAPGSGSGIACVADVGDDESDVNEGGLSGIAEILISTGPFQGYHNAGATDVTQHQCDSNTAQTHKL